MRKDRTSIIMRIVSHLASCHVARFVSRSPQPYLNVTGVVKMDHVRSSRRERRNVIKLKHLPTAEH